jgi:hypothetical protein
MSRKNKKALPDIACPGPVGVLRVAEWLKRNGFQEESQSARRLLKSAVPINDIEGIPHLGVEPGAYLQNKSLRPGFYIYVLKLHNIIDGKQVYSNENPELPIYNWYVGMAANPIARLRQHEVKSISINSDAQALLSSYLGELEAQYSIEEIIGNKQEHIKAVVWRVFREFPNMFELDSSNIPESNYVGRKHGPHPMPSQQTEYNARCGSLWTSLHGVIEMVWNKHYDESESISEKENGMYREMVSRYGESHVRGGSYCRLPDSGSDMGEIMTSEYTVATDNAFPSNQLDVDASEIMKYLENARHSDEEVVEEFRSNQWLMSGLIRDIYQDYKRNVDHKRSDANPKRRTRPEERRFKANKKLLKEKQEALSEGLFQEYEEHLGVRYHTHYETGLRMGIKAITPKSDFLNTRIIKEIESGGDNPFPSPLGDELWGKILDYYRNFAGQSGQLKQLELGVSEYIYLTFLSSRFLPKSVKIVGIKEAFEGMSRKRSHLPKYIELLPDGRLAPKSSILEQINIDLSSPDGLLGSILPKLPHGNRASAKRTFDRMKSIARNPNADLEMFAEAIAKFIKSLSSGLSLSVTRRATDTTGDETRGAVEAIRESTNSLVRQERLDGLLTTAKRSPSGSRLPAGYKI